MLPGGTTARPPEPGVGRGACFVVLGLVVDLPYPARPVGPAVAPEQELSKTETAATVIRFLVAARALGLVRPGLAQDRQRRADSVRAGRSRPANGVGRSRRRC